ncbi:16S rRNA (cytidine(1402)-2'-O)-methyltransferase [Gammaproteobacteria bacterium]|nr:16S rRNA (cytidine(1402)-2'-O)-methyltransferase [Gammaproteobacteria bacterium]
MLYLICTPIGNLNDLSLRSINTLKEVDYIYAEDTRVSAKLFQHFNISKKSLPFHEHNEIKQMTHIINSLFEGYDVAIMSDAGAPLISDPGYPLIQKCIERNLDFTVLPGPSSVINAILLSGIPSHQFTFYGFLPKPEIAIKKVAIEIKRSGIPYVFFESAKRLAKTLKIFLEVLDNNTQVSICREMTKEYESIYRGSLDTIYSQLLNSEITLLGEFVLVIQSSLKSQIINHLEEDFCKPFLEYMSPSDASKLIAKITSHSKQDVYKFLLSISNSS